MSKARHPYRLTEDGKLVCAEGHIPHESAGYMFYFKTPEGKTNVILFASNNAKKIGGKEYEFATFGKADFGFIKKDATELDNAINKTTFMRFVEQYGEEQPWFTALREAVEETDRVITHAPKDKHTHMFQITTSPHSCWVDDTVVGQKKDDKSGEMKDIKRTLQTIMTTIPYELTAEQYHQLVNKKDYTKFVCTAEAELIKNNEGKLQLMLNGADLFDVSNKALLRGFNSILLQHYNQTMMNMFGFAHDRPSVHAAKNTSVAQFGSFANSNNTVAAEPSAKRLAGPGQ